MELWDRLSEFKDIQLNKTKGERVKYWKRIFNMRNIKFFNSYFYQQGRRCEVGKRFSSLKTLSTIQGLGSVMIMINCLTKTLFKI